MLVVPFLLEPKKHTIMATKSRKKTPVTQSLVGVMLPSDYKNLLNGAGFQNHRALTGKKIEFSGLGVEPISLGDAYRSLESLKNGDTFEQDHLKNDAMRSGVRKLTELLYLYKDFKRE